MARYVSRFCRVMGQHTYDRLSMAPNKYSRRHIGYIHSTRCPTRRHISHRAGAGAIELKTTQSCLMGHAIPITRLLSTSGAPHGPSSQRKMSKLAQYLDNIEPLPLWDHKQELGKKMEYGSQNDSGYWVNGNTGLQSGFKLKEELAASNAFTVPEIMEFAAKKYKGKPCYATRELLKREKIKEGENTFEKLEQGEYIWTSYEDVQKQVLQVSEGMKKLGFGIGDRVAILSETQADWYIGALGSLRQGIVIVTVYTTLSDSGLIHAIKDSDIKTVFTSHDIFPRLIKVIPECSDIERIIVMEDQLEGIGEKTGLPNSVQVMSMNELKKMGEGVKAEPSVPKPDDLAIIMYTSGSTGNPKGVEITHKNIMCAVTGYLIRADFGEDARYLSFLPLAHVMELSTEAALMAMGVGICYSSPMTLSNNSPKVKKVHLEMLELHVPQS
ncbi:unnamed protein product [Meganyctiphanes norvegica]|uniref:long-chain-fatty-acid--CoA ligase n=1 Tax=Meganyctiphanes norvegica TaxID=48144 RepID=A0AAV2QW38_MEGNR